MKKLILSLFAMTLLLSLLPGCNTIAGAGHDVSAVGSDVAAGAHAVSRNL